MSAHKEDIKVQYLYDKSMKSPSRGNAEKDDAVVVTFLSLYHR